MQDSVEAAVIMSLGDRVTKFRPRTLDSFEPQKEGDEYGVKPQREVLGAMWQWGLLYAEMGAVLTIFAPVLPLYAVRVSWGIMVQAFKWAGYPRN